MTTKTLVIILIVLAQVSSPIANAQESKPKLEKQGIKVWTEKVPGSRIKQFVAEVDINARIDTVASLLSDISRCREWLHNCTKGIELLRNSFNDRHLYQVNSMHKWAKSRDYVVHSSVSRNPETGQITIQLNADNDFCTNKKSETCQSTKAQPYIRIKVLKGLFTLTPINDNQVTVHWQQHLEPGGRLPPFIVNNLLVDIPWNSLNNIRHLAEKENSKPIRMRFDQAGQILSIEDR